jgi:hypothetical protein
MHFQHTQRFRDGSRAGLAISVPLVRGGDRQKVTP